ncbi:UPF0183 protein CG7083 [Papilio machaon]|uniref:UPF0183 protein CG7083 n=1 Tax=Papilio machaon TaxID=76193 RepID=A0A0N0PER5_PAPMA|nr:UPF0183 protein CG7083 [Papilio machaon]
MPQDGIRLIFDPVAQRLKIIEIDMIMKGVTTEMTEVQGISIMLRPNDIIMFARLFPARANLSGTRQITRPGYAHGLGSLQFPNGGSPVVSRTTIYYGSQHQLSSSNSSGRCAAPLPELPLSCYRQQLHLRRCDVLRSPTATLALRLHMYTEGCSRSGEGTQSIRRVVRFGDSCQAVSRALAAPARLYYKADDKMRIHRPTARRRPPPASDYFFNYFTLGLTMIYIYVKFHQDTLSRSGDTFMYHRCEFELTVQPDKSESNTLVESRGAVTITAYSKWETVSRALRVCERPVVLNRASSTNTTNPFGSTFCYGYQDIIFEVMSNNYIASITLYQPEGTRPHYEVNSIA